MAALALATLLVVLGAGAPPDAERLAIIDNAVRHEAPAPRYAPPLVRELFARPMDARDAAAIFDRLVPRPVVAAAAPHAPLPAQPFERLLAAYVDELAIARAELLAATGNAPLDEKALLADLTKNGHPSVDRLLAVAAATDLDGLAVANERFIAATTRFALALRSADGLPTETTRIDTALGTIVIGSRGDDVHELAPATNGAISVVIDLGGNDTYRGSDIAVRGFSAIIDFAGDDRYELSGPGLGAAVAGASLLLDFAGNDSYRAPHISQGMAAFGIGVLIDLGGDDQYDLDAWGQGFGLAGGLGLLWDAGGNDRYTARGPADGYDRGGGLSGAQGVAMGPRTFLAGGIGILRDDAGDDVYVAEMFAQGTGYYYGLGLLWDRGGNDHYNAVRYAQGNGVHEAVGVLRDEAGNDHYALKVGVGQGMGLDLALGVLFDAGGDDVYHSGSLAQGSGTANGIGVLEDVGGADRFEISYGDKQWGHAQWLRGLPTVGVFLYDPARASFMSGGKPVAGPPAPHKEAEPEPAAKCPAGITIAPAELDTLRRDYFEAVSDIGQRLRCAVGDPQHAEPLWNALEAELARYPDSPLGIWIAFAYGASPRHRRWIAPCSRGSMRIHVAAYARTHCVRRRARKRHAVRSARAAICCRRLRCRCCRRRAHRFPRTRPCRRSCARTRAPAPTTGRCSPADPRRLPPPGSALRSRPRGARNRRAARCCGGSRTGGHRRECG